MEEVIFDDYDECEAEKTSEMKAVKNQHYSRGIRKCALALALAVVVSTGFSAVPGKFNNMATVEAAGKKDKKKPVIKLSGKSNIRVTQNESVKIPKATAKDNVDGNVTKKIKVSVRSGKKSYSALAKKIRKNKAVKFTKTGKYTITYTVSDKAKNKATKKRTVTVVAKQEDKKTTENKTTAEQTTENKTTTEQVTTAATTEKTTTEAPTTEKDLLKNVDIKKVTINGITYNVTTDSNFSSYASTVFATSSNDIKIVIDNDYSYIVMDAENGLWDNFEYLKYYGNIKAYDKNNRDITNNVIICSSQRNPKNGWYTYIYIYVKDSYGNETCKQVAVKFTNIFESDDDYFNENHLISDNPIIYGSKRENK